MKNDELAAGVRALLSQEMRTSFDDIVQQKVLGANAHIAMIGEMIVGISQDGLAQGKKTTEVLDAVDQLAKYFVATRGEASQAVSNAIALMTRGNDLLRDEDSETACQQVNSKVKAYGRLAAEATERSVATAVSLCEPFNTILVFDYSSSVDKVLSRLSSGGGRVVYIAESRIINGGSPFVKTCLEAGHTVHFIPDASIMHFAKEVDVALMGAETFFPDGTGFNTTGSDIVGLVCDYYKIPLYFITPFIKLDARPTTGYHKELLIVDARSKLAPMLDESVDAESINFLTPELVGVDPAHIRGFVTEFGIIPSGQMFAMSADYREKVLDVE